MGGGIGLIALVLGALFNAFLNRRRDDRLREVEKRAVAAALRAELGTIHRALVENATMLRERAPSTDDGVLVPNLSDLIKIMPELLSRIGLLGYDTVREVMRSYFVVYSFFDRIVMLGARPQPNLPKPNSYAMADSDKAGRILTLCAKTADILAASITALDRILEGTGS